MEAFKAIKKSLIKFDLNITLDSLRDSQKVAVQVLKGCENSAEWFESRDTKNKWKLASISDLGHTFPHKCLQIQTHLQMTPRSLQSMDFVRASEIDFLSYRKS
jgi:hypothetical protein